ncbi:MAG: hypothetical protein DRG78_09590 [Epsilonproteobacteria bacterium]|nr:MAG: hypothetical protein DRG78_09590 [Campylobacterota bacterium]
MQFILSFFIIFIITGCALNIQPKPKKETTASHYQMEDEHISTNLNTTIIDIANQLFNTSKDKKNPPRLILTSFVDLNKLDKTTIFGRLVSESMFNELHIRKFKVTDFRGQDAVNVNEDGEFHISRDTEKLKDSLEHIEYILVGTYVKFENQSLLINARILDSISGDIISSARAVYQPKDCRIFGICKNIDAYDEPKYDIYKTENSDNIKTKDNDDFTIISDKKKD